MPALADGPIYAYGVPDTQGQPRQMTPDDWQKNADGVAEDPDKPMSDTARAFRNGWVQRGNYDEQHLDEITALAEEHQQQAMHAAQQQQEARNGIPPLPGVDRIKPPLPPAMQHHVARQQAGNELQDPDEAQVQPVAPPPVQVVVQQYAPPRPPSADAHTVPVQRYAPPPVQQAYVPPPGPPQSTYVVVQGVPPALATGYWPRGYVPRYAPPPQTYAYYRPVY